MQISIESGSLTPGRYRTFSRFACISCRCSAFRSHMRTECPLRASSFARAVPQLPAPMTAICLLIVDSYFLKLIFDSS